MKAKLKDHHSIKYEQDSKIMQLSDFPELSDQELELLVGGCDSNISVQDSLPVAQWISSIPPIPILPVPPAGTS